MAKKSMNKSKFGLAPGTAVFTGIKKTDNLNITVTQYSEKSYEEIVFNTIDDLKNYIKSIDSKKGEKNSLNIWINIDGIHDEKFIEELTLNFNIHKLTIEDILSVGQRAKIEIHSDYIHVVTRVFNFNSIEKNIEDEQLTIIRKDRFIITFQERETDIFNGLKKRIKEGIGTIRKRGSDYLLYAILDSITDHYIVISEQFNDKLDSLETELFENGDNVKLEQLYKVRREVILFKRSISPMREVVNSFEKLDEPIVSNDIKLFIRDLYDHTIMVVDSTDSLRESIYALLDLYMNNISNKTNEIMKVLTIMASIFIPLTFIAGVYGMNFDNMPELHTNYGYFVILAIMVSVLIFMILYFKRKKWIK
ncbi:magnesium/cobalt transporter CorA [bacterium]|nr:magnesium/cobalt transporter CorA [bacterium]